MPTQTLQILGSYGIDVEIEYAEIQRDFGDGYDANELVGNTAGELFYRLTYDYLPQTTVDFVLDPENANAVTSYADYLWLFFTRRKVDGAAFNITDPKSGATVLVKFVDRRLSLKLINYKLFTSGLLLRQHRT